MVLLTNFPPPTEGVLLSQPNTSAFVGKRECRNGTLYIAESRLSWMGESGLGFSVEYIAIAIHAISKDRNAFPNDCLYLQLSCKLDSDAENSTSEEDEDDEYPITEVRLVPQDSTKLKEMYDTLCHCQALHPDPNDSNSEDSEAEFDEDGGGDDSYEEDDLTIEQQAALERYDNLLAAGEPTPNAAAGEENHVNGTAQVESMETGQFEDASNEPMQ